MEEGWTDEEIYRDVLRPVSRLSLLSETTLHDDSVYTSSQDPSIKEAEAALRQLEEFSNLLKKERNELLRKAQEEIEKEWEGKQSEIEKQRAVVVQLLVDLRGSARTGEPPTRRLSQVRITKPCLTPLPPIPSTLSALEAAISALRLENSHLEEQLRAARRPVPHEDQAVVDALLTRDIDHLTQRVLQGVFDGEPASGARWQCRESLARLQVTLGRLWKEQSGRAAELTTTVQQLTDQHSVLQQELQSAQAHIQRLTQAQQSILAVHKCELDKRTRLSEDMRCKTYESHQVGQTAQVASLKGTVSGLEAQVTALKLSLAAAIKEKTELRESLCDGTTHTFETDLHTLLKSVEEALIYPREHALLRGLRADIMSMIARLDKRRGAIEDKENSYETDRGQRRRVWRSESQGGPLPSEELAQYLSHLSHRRK